MHWRVTLFGLALLSISPLATAQQTFELRVPGAESISHAELNNRELLIVDSRNRRFAYARRPDFDSPNGKYLGFMNLALPQAIRWPKSGSGFFHIGSLSRAGRITYRESRMTVHALRAPRFAAREIGAANPLPPAEVTLTNSHTRELWVLITDLRDPKAAIRMRLKPGEKKDLSLQRDAGGRVVETFETLGRIEQRAYDLPPQPLYDVSVYELFLQSVAIDRTKRGQGKVEDINWSPRSIGIFPVPPGNLLPERAKLDVYAKAKAEHNPGAVRRLDREQWKVDNTVPADLRAP